MRRTATTAAAAEAMPVWDRRSMPIAASAHADVRSSLYSAPRSPATTRSTTPRAGEEGTSRSAPLVQNQRARDRLVSLLLGACRAIGSTAATGTLNSMALQRRPPKTVEEPFEYARGLGPLRLYLDDIADLHQLLIPRCGRVVFSARSAVADDAEDLRSATNDELMHIGFTTTEPRLTVWLYRQKAKAAAREDTSEARALVDDIAGLLAPRRSARAFLRAMHMLNAIGLAGLLLLAVVIFRRPDSIGGPIMFAVMCLALYVMVASTVRGTGATSIVLRRRHEERTMSSTTRTTVITALVTALVTAPVAVAITLISSGLMD